MKLRIKELAREHGYSLEAVANHLHITPVSLSQSLNGNPTLKRLEEVADVFGVDVSELFVKSIKNDVHGCIYVNGQPRLITTKHDITSILKEIEESEQRK